MSSFGLIEKNMELSHNFLAVHRKLFQDQDSLDWKKCLKAFTDSRNKQNTEQLSIS